MVKTKNQKLRLAMIMSTEVGLRTQYLNWHEHFPKDLDVEPVWVIMTFEKPGGLIERLPIPRQVRSTLRGQLEIAEAFKAGPFDGIFIAVHSALSMFSSVLDKVPCFMTFDVTPKQLHNFGPIYQKSPSRFKLYEAFKHSRRTIAYQKCKALFPWSRWAAESGINDYGAERNRTHVMPPGVDLIRWSPKERWSKPQKAVCDLLFVGGDFERKGGHLLLDWAEKSPRMDFRLHIVTRQPITTDDPRIRSYCNLMPNDPNLVALYENADAFVLPTLADCYSLAGLEAMASGLPVILSETGGTGDIIKDGINGFLIKPGDANALAEALEKLLSSTELRESMGRAARSDAEARYDVAANIRRTVVLMREQMGH